MTYTPPIPNCTCDLQRVIREKRKRKEKIIIITIIEEEDLVPNREGKKRKEKDQDRHDPIDRIHKTEGQCQRDLIAWNFNRHSICNRCKLSGNLF